MQGNWEDGDACLAGESESCACAFCPADSVGPNQRSFSLYSSLGFVPVECITQLYGSVDSSKAEAAAAALGISTAGIETRRMEEGDVEACSALFTEAGLGILEGR